MNNYDIDTLVQIKSSFQSNKFQWIKTNDRSKLGTVVEVRDVLPGRNNRFIAVLSDGSRLDTDEVSSNLMMLTDDQTAMSMQEVLSINYIPSLSDDLKVSADLPQDYASEILTKPEPVSSPVKAVNSDPQATVTEPSKVSVDTTDLFGMFSLEDTDLELTVRVKLPAKELLKMMYANSKNKDEFLTKLSNYINNSVTSDSIKKTMKKFFSGSASRKKSSRSDD